MGWVLTHGTPMFDVPLFLAPVVFGVFFLPILGWEQIIEFIMPFPWRNAMPYILMALFYPALFAGIFLCIGKKQTRAVITCEVLIAAVWIGLGLLGYYTFE